jgi:hypothetical protein
MQKVRFTYLAMKRERLEAASKEPFPVLREVVFNRK